MSIRPSHLAVIPAYNEAETVGEVVRAIHRHVPDLRRAGGGRRVDRPHGRDCARAPERCVVRHPFNLGIGGAVQSGFVYALENGYEYMVQVDGDGQHEPRRDRAADSTAMEEDPTLDMVCGSRFLTRTSGIRRRSAAAPGSTSSPSSLSRIVGQRMSDPTSGFRLYNRRAITLFARDYPHDYPEVEAVLMVHHQPPADARDAGADVHARGRALVDHLWQVGVLHDQGAARDLRRPGPRAALSRARRRGAGGRRARTSDGAPHPARRDRRVTSCCS